MNGILIFLNKTRPGDGGFSPTVSDHGISALQHLIITCQTARLSPVIVLTVNRADVEIHLARMGVICLGPNDESADEYDACFRQALTMLQEGARRIFFAPADFPLYKAETLHALLAYPQTPVRPVNEEAAGWPLAVSPIDITEITAADPDALHPDRLIRALAERCVGFPCSDPGCFYDLSRTDQWSDLLRTHRHRRLRPVSRLTLAREQIFLGPGTAQLLSAIEKTSSVRRACQLSGISYSKGWRMIRQMEDQFGRRIVGRQKGGPNGGKAYLTGPGKTLLERYRSYTAACELEIDRLFHEYFF